MWPDLMAQEYGGAYQTVAAVMVYLRHQERQLDRSLVAAAGLTVRQAVTLLV